MRYISGRTIISVVRRASIPEKSHRSWFADDREILETILGCQRKCPELSSTRKALTA